MINQDFLPIATSIVDTYDGGAVGSVPLGAQPSLNSVLVAIGDYISGLTIPTGFSSDDILLDVDCTGTGTVTGETLSVFFADLTSTLAAIDLSPYLLKSTYDAHTILYATTDNTPVALTIGTSTFVGRKSAGNISAMSVAEAITELATVNKDADSVFPYNTALPFSVGDSAATDKTLLVIKDTGTWALNPFFKWGHSILGAGEGLVIQGKATTDNFLKVLAKTADAGFYALSDGATSSTKDQQLVLADRVSPSDPHYYWYIRKDGNDNSYLKIGYYDNVSETEMLQINKTTGKFSFNGTTEITGVIDEDSFATDSAVHVPTQQSVKAYITANTAGSTEVNAIETGAGLNGDGTYTADGAATYIAGATSLKNADSLLDAQIKLINDKDVQATAAISKHVQCAYATFAWNDQATTGVFALEGAKSLPDNSVITYVRVDVTTVFTDDGINTSTIGIGINNIGAGTEDINVAAAIGTDYTLGLKNDAWLTYVHTTGLKLTAARNITVNVVLAGGATTLSTGKFSIYLEYFVTE